MRTELYRRLAAWLLCGLVGAAPARAAWDSFEIVEWQNRDPAQLATLHRLGVSAAMVMADRDGTGTPLARQTPAPRAAGLRWYVENLATDLYASYHRYTPGQPVNWRFIAAQERYRANPADPTALFREPSLSDPAWRERIGTRLIDTVRQQKANRPLFYSLGDETGIADLSAYWDFDLSPPSVAGFRTWLRDQYGSLAALNAEWGTAYTSWDAIQPETTNTAMRRTDDNFAAWNDFKAWMDTEFASALRFGTDAVHHADPAALSGIEGVQIPGWGGYDYSKLAPAVDVVELGDDGIDLPMLRSINPRLTALETSFVANPDELHRLWRGVLDGVRGLILWDEDNSIVGQDAAPGPRAAVYAPVFKALRGEIGRRMIAAEPIYDNVAILYSPVSFRVRWMLDHRPLGDAWMHRAADIELEDNAWRVSLREFATALEHMGLRAKFITPEQLAHGQPAYSALILPHSIALSDQETRAIAAFAASGGRVIADTPPGLFDGHGRRRDAPSIAATIVVPGDLARVLPLAPTFAVEAPDNDVDIFLFNSRGQRLLAVHRRVRGAAPESVTVDLNGWHARDIATDHDYGRPRRLALTLDPITPAFLEISR